MGKLILLGDSVTAGAWDEQGGWANRICSKVMALTAKAYHDKQNSFYCFPYNLGVSGNTVQDLIDRLDDELPRRFDLENEKEEREFLISIGINDVAPDMSLNKSKVVEEQELEEKIRTLISKAQKHSTHFAFTGILPVDEDLVAPLPWDETMVFTNERVQTFENIIENVCAQLGVPFLSLYKPWIKRTDYKDLLFDGLHPNTKGHEILAEQIFQFILDHDFIKRHS